jgi:hypothetical protein
MQFILALALLLGSITIAPQGISGTITIGPTQPNCVPATGGCRIPYATAVTATANGTTLTTQSDANGHYYFPVGGGIYTVTSCVGTGGGPKSVTVTVPFRGGVTANLACDTGIR